MSQFLRLIHFVEASSQHRTPSMTHHGLVVIPHDYQHTLGSGYIAAGWTQSKTRSSKNCFKQLPSAFQTECYSLRQPPFLNSLACA